MAGAMLYSPAAMADWHNPYVYRESHDEWTNVHYDDGVCEYKFAHNSWDNETHVNRWGDCARVAIGPNGEAMPIAAPILGYGE